MQSRYDLIVVGGGIIGCSIAWRLAQRGLRIAVFDAGSLGGEASSAAAGMLAPGGEIHQSDPLATLLLQGQKLYPGFVKELEAESQQAIDYRVSGALEVAHSAAEWEQLKARAALQRGLGIQIEERSNGLFYPEDAYVNPHDVLSALRAALLKRAVSIFEHHPVHFVQADSHGVRVGEWEARQAVIAAGAWSSQIYITGCSLPSVRPIKGHLIGYQLRPGSLPYILRNQNVYLVQRVSGFTIAGSSLEDVGFHRDIDPAVVQQIEQRARRLAPDLLAGVQPVRVWTGFRPAPAEGGQPVMQQLCDRPVWAAYGHFRNGILAAPAVAQWAQRAILASLEKAPASSCEQL